MVKTPISPWVVFRQSIAQHAEAILLREEAEDLRFSCVLIRQWLHQERRIQGNRWGNAMAAVHAALIGSERPSARTANCVCISESPLFQRATVSGSMPAEDRRRMLRRDF